MNILPTYHEIVALHHKYAPSDAAFDLIFTHCTIVWEIAEQLINTAGLTIDSELVRAGCLLHDIGVYDLYLPDGTIDHQNYIKHGTLGYDRLKGAELSETLCRIASHHTGVGLDKEEIIEHNLPIPAADYFATTTEEQLIMYADKFHTKSTPPTFMTATTYEDKLAQFGEVKVQRFKSFQKQFGIPDLQPLAKKYNSRII